MKMAMFSRLTKFVLVLAVAILGAGLTTAHADTINTFVVSGTFDNGSVLNGTILINTTLGTVVSGSFTTSLPTGETFTFFVPGVTGFYGNEYVVDFSQVSPDSPQQTPYLALVLPVNTLVGLPDGNLCDTSSAPCDATLLALGDGSFQYLTSGTIVDPPANTPEPATLSLIGSGLIGLGLLRRTRRLGITTS